MIPGMPTVIPPGLTREQERAYIGKYTFCPRARPLRALCAQCCLAAGLETCCQLLCWGQTPSGSVMWLVPNAGPREGQGARRAH